MIYKNWKKENQKKSGRDRRRSSRFSARRRAEWPLKLRVQKHIISQTLHPSAQHTNFDVNNNWTEQLTKTKPHKFIYPKKKKKDINTHAHTHTPTNTHKHTNSATSSNKRNNNFCQSQIIKKPTGKHCSLEKREKWTDLNSAAKNSTISYSSRILVFSPFLPPLINPSTLSTVVDKRQQIKVWENKSNGRGEGFWERILQVLHEFFWSFTLEESKIGILLRASSLI